MNRLSLHDVAFISHEQHESMIGSAVQAGDMLLNITGASIGRVACVPDMVNVANVNQHVCRIRFGQGVEPAFICYFLSTPRGQAQIMGSQFGTTRQGLNYGNVRAIRVPLPDVREQRAIADILQTVHRAKEVRQCELALENERKAALMDYLFTYGSRDEALEESEVGQVPQTWEITTLERVSQRPAQNGAFIKGAIFGEGTPYVNVYDIYQGAILDSERVQRLRWDDPAKERYLLNQNDVLFVRSSLKREGVGQCCLVRELKEPAIFDCHLIRVSPDPHVVDPLFLTYFFLSEARRADLIGRSKTTTMTTLNQNMLMQSQVALPSLGEQVEISKALFACDSKIAGLQVEMERLQELFEAILEELMAGRMSALP